MGNPNLIERISKISADQILAAPVIPGINEMQVVEDAINRARIIRTQFGDVELPGMTLNKDFLVKAVADFKKNVAYNAPVEFTSRVTANNIAVESLDRPQVYSGFTTFRQTGLTTGAYVPILSQTSGTAIKTVLNHERYIITDMVEFDPTAGIEGILVISDGDNNSQPLSIGAHMRTENALRIVPLDFPQIADVSLNVAGRLVQGTDTELVPMGIRIFIGDQVRAI